MKILKRSTGLTLLKLAKVFPAKSAVAGLIIALGALLATSATSCVPQVRCYDTVPIDTIPHDTLDSSSQIPPTDNIENTDEKY